MGSANLEAGATSPRSDSIAIPTSGHSPVQLVCCTIYLPIFSSSSLSPSKSQSRESNAINSYMYLWTVSPSHRRWKANRYIYWGEPKRIKSGHPFFLSDKVIEYMYYDISSIDSQKELFRFLFSNTTKIRRNCHLFSSIFLTMSLDPIRPLPT